MRETCHKSARRSKKVKGGQGTLREGFEANSDISESTASRLVYEPNPSSVHGEENWCSRSSLERAILWGKIMG